MDKMDTWGYMQTSMEKSNINPSDNVDIRNYYLLECLGRGTYSDVYRAQHKVKGFEVAVKIMTEKLNEAEKFEQLIQEANNQLKLKHNNVLRVYGYYHGFQRLCLYLEYASLGSLRMHLLHSKKFRERTVGAIIYKIADVLDYCHSQKVIHRDLKPDNILVDKYATIKLGDFGCSSYSPADMQSTFCGTSYYIAPEILLGPYNHKVDNWSLGIVCYELIIGKPPFQGKNISELLNAIRAGLSYYPPEMPPGPKDLISRLLMKPSLRLSLLEALQHPWLKMHARAPLTFKGPFIV